MSSFDSNDLMNFQEGKWSEICITLAAEAARRCGSSHDQYVRRFSEMVDLRINGLPAEMRLRAIAQAQRWDYASAETRSAMSDRSSTQP